MVGPFLTSTKRGTSSKKFCKWCNKEARVSCKVCGFFYCRTHGDDSLETIRLYIREDFSFLELASFTYALDARFPDQSIPKEYGGSSIFDGTYRHFTERVYPEMNFEIKILRGPLCNYCRSNVEQRFIEKLFSVLRSVKESGLICAYHHCPLDAEEKCENCNKYFCKNHLVRCSRCGKLFCCLTKSNVYPVRPLRGCQNAHKHRWRTRRWE